MQKPLIGIVLDRETNGDYSEYPYYVLREHYFDAVSKAGGIPVGLDLNNEMVAEYVELVDGLLLPGGDYDIPPEFYGESSVHQTTVTKSERLDYDVAIATAFLQADKPVLGICAGQQLLAAMHDGKLIQDIASEIPAALEHYKGLRTEAVHEISVVPGTQFHEIVGVDTMQVNSHHHQAVKDGVGDFVVSARSADGVVEAIEFPDKKFCLGFEWHPEFLISDEEEKIFAAFVKACVKE